jgi:hypothetical protein
MRHCRANSSCFGASLPIWITVFLPNKLVERYAALETEFTCACQWQYLQMNTCRDYLDVVYMVFYGQSLLLTIIFIWIRMFVICIPIFEDGIILALIHAGTPCFFRLVVCVYGINIFFAIRFFST